MSPCVRAGLPLDEALSRAAPATGCRASERAALAAASLASSGAPIDEVTNALLLPPAVRARLALAATRAPDAFADALGPLADDCARRYRDALDRRMRWFQPMATLFAGAIVMAQLFGIFAMLALVRSQVPTW
jgi:type II secretory pathway component PulF